MRSPDGRDGLLLHRRLWGKTGPGGTYHPLICHMIDVAEVALAMWSWLLGEGLRSDLMRYTGLGGAETAGELAFVTALHDLGKASPEFQRLSPDLAAGLREAGFDFPNRVDPNSPGYHGVITAQVLPPILEDVLGVPKVQARALATSVGGHHGSWPLPNEKLALRAWHWGEGVWEAARLRIVEDLTALYGPIPMPEQHHEPEVQNAVMAVISGLTSVADWIGSDESRFPHTPLGGNLEEYRDLARSRAAKAVSALRWTDWAPATEPATFRELVHLEPRPLQIAAEELGATLSGPSLTVIEASTGTGKTEAGYCLADIQVVSGGLRGLYVAMPTMATSNQMHERMTKLLEWRYPGVGSRALLVHSRARLAVDRDVGSPDIADESVDPETAAADALSWFLPRKRSLLSPLAVGTVDQAFLSVLQTRHFFVRLFGLSRKVVIFDEVHAYDTYMSVLFQRLLSWLRAVGTSVVILSATLPGETRRRLVSAYAGCEVELGAAPYPSITWWSRDESGVVPLEEPKARTLRLEWIDGSPGTLVQTLKEALASGGCAAVVCNTVPAAQDCYRELSNAGVVDPDNLWLFHARFPFRRRREIETAVLQAFGKDGERPERAVLVATQVVEQSLDLDFDVMVTQLPPVDLLLQRAGRLHRHERGGRPQAVSEPRLLVIEPMRQAEGIDFGASAWVYEPYVLIKTLATLEGRSAITTPADTQPLIESVYGDDEPEGPYADLLTEARASMRQQEEGDGFVAQQKLIGDASAPRLLSYRNLALWEDQPELHQTVQALTRLGPPSVNLVCLWRRDDRLYLDDDYEQEIDLRRAPDDNLAQALSDRSLSCSQAVVFHYFVAQDPPRGWRRHPYLRDHRVVVFCDGIASLGDTGYVIRLSDEYGLEVIKEKR